MNITLLQYIEIITCNMIGWSCFPGTLNLVLKITKIIIKLSKNKYI